jgi:CheY-like chemotaxis protein
MPKNILIVESDSALSHSMRAELEAHGFSVEETSDGKGSVELIRRQRPDLVLMEVDLSAGQNGYILCGKLKKDDELKSIPIVIVGNSDGFAQHRKLKTRADDYVSKPVDTTALVQGVGNLIGFPEVAQEEVIEETLSISDLVDIDEPATGDFAAEEIQVEEDATVAGDPDLDMLDAAFGQATSSEADLGASPPPVAAEDDPFSALDALGIEESTGSSATYVEEDAADRTVVGFMPDLAPEPEPEPEPAPEPMAVTSPFRPVAAPATSSTDPAELRALRAKVTELEGALSDAQSSASEYENRVRDLEEQVSARDAELEATRATAHDGSKEQVFALRAESNKKDKEILRLKSELNEKDQEIFELRDKSLQLEQQLSEGSGEMARKDAQIKTLQTRADQLAAERKRFDQQLLSAKEEARTASANLTTVQAELDDARGRLEGAQSELEALRERTGDLESQLRQARDEGDELRRESEQLRESSDGARRELDELRGQLEQAQIDIDAAKNQLNAQATAFADEAGGLRRRVTELEQSAQKYEDRIARFYSKIKENEKVREKTRKALAIALQLLDEQQQARIDIDVDVDVDESADA